jgi:hypothetical protein
MGFFDYLLIFGLILLRLAWIYHNKLNNLEFASKNGGRVKNHFEGVPLWRKPFVFFEVIRGTRVD